MYVGGNFKVVGKLTAQEFHTNITSASIIYASGSTQFGNSMDDIHNITGSVYTTGSFTINTELSSSAELTVEGNISASGDILLEDGHRIWHNESLANETSFIGASGQYAFYSGSTTQMVFDLSSNDNKPLVGIGTATPVKTLTVEGDISASGNLYIVNSASIGRTNTGSAALTVEGNISASGDIYFRRYYICIKFLFNIKCWSYC